MAYVWDIGLRGGDTGNCKHTEVGLMGKVVGGSGDFKIG